MRYRTVPAYLCDSKSIRLLAGQGRRVKPESRLEIFKRRVAEAEAAVARQKRLIEDLEREGHPTQGSHILLGLLEDALRNAKDALVTMKFKRGQRGPKDR